MFEHLTTMSSDYFSSQRTGDLISRINGDVRGLQSSITSVTLDAFKAPITILVTLPIILVMGGKLALICIGVFPVVAVPIVMLGRKIKKFTSRSAESHADITSFLNETLAGMSIIKTTWS
jgi:subfamily B ATP-binding cassette protein MsbA